MNLSYSIAGTITKLRFVCKVCGTWTTTNHGFI
ncbi:hypothetical protein LEP1GSC033_1851, partial [Leptospira interrogans str. 2002000632]